MSPPSSPFFYLSSLFLSLPPSIPASLPPLHPTQFEAHGPGPTKTETLESVSESPSEPPSESPSEPPSDSPSESPPGPAPPPQFEDNKFHGRGRAWFPDGTSTGLVTWDRDVTQLAAHAFRDGAVYSGPVAGFRLHGAAGALRLPSGDSYQVPR